MNQSVFPIKFLLLDGISGVPLGKEIAENLREAGHSVVHFDCLKQQSRAFYGIRSAYAKIINRHAEKESFYLLPRLNVQALEKLADEVRPTHILVIGFIYKFFDPEDLRRIANTRHAQLLLYDTDSCNLYGKRREFIFFIERELPIYTKIFSFSQITTRFFRDTRGLPASHLPFGAQPIALPGAEAPPIDALFVGSGDLRRLLLLENIRENVTIYGNRWHRNFPLISHELQAKITDIPMWGDALHALLARSKIVLNITRTDFYGAETGVNLRIFECVAAGCFLLTDYCEELEELFDIGQEIETFRSSRELAEKVRYYLAHDDERRAIARRGHERFKSSHTWRSRIEQLVL